LERDDQGAARPLFATQLMQRSQDLPSLYCPTGAVWWSTSESLRRHGTFHIEPRALFELSWENGIDVDAEADLELAELLFERIARRAAKDDGETDIEAILCRTPSHNDESVVDD